MTTTKTQEKLPCSVDALYLSVRAYNILKNRKIKTIKDLVDTDARELLASPNCGRKTVAEILANLKMAGLRMENSDGMFPDSVIESHVTSIREHIANLREPKPKVETYHDKLAKEIKMKQLMVMLMRVNGNTFSSIAKEIGRTEGTARIYFSRFSRSLVREAEKRKLSVADILSERNIPLAALELIRKDGIQV